MLKPKIAKHDPAHCLAAGLFKTYANSELLARMRDGMPIYDKNKDGSLKKRKTKHNDGTVTMEPIPLMYRPGYVSEYTYGESTILKFSVAEGLGADDLRVLQGLVAFAGNKTLVLGPHPKNEDEDGSIKGAKLLRDNLRTTGAAVKKPGLIIHSTFGDLARAIGYEDGNSGSTTSQIRECVERLYGVSILVTNIKSGKSEGFRLLSHYESEISKTGSKSIITVGLNPRLAQAVVCGVDSGYTRIDLEEVSKIKIEGTRLIHQRLCGWINQGASREVSIETICAYIWMERAKMDGTHRKRLLTTRTCLAELASLGWGIDEYRKGYVRIARPKQMQLLPDNELPQPEALPESR